MGVTSGAGTIYPSRAPGLYMYKIKNRVTVNQIVKGTRILNKVQQYMKTT
jgi:hypothetical protein